MPHRIGTKAKGLVSRGLADVRERSGVLKLSCAHFLVALVVMIIAAPFLEEAEGGDFLDMILLSLVLLSAVLAVGSRRGTLIWAIVLMAPCLAGKWINHARPDLVPAEFYLVVGIAFVGFVAVQLFRFILRAPWVSSEVLCAGVSVYLVLGLLWAFGYILVDRLHPGSFSFSSGPDPSRQMKGFTSLYYSLVTLTTMGYGDIVPVSGAARLLAMAEATTGMFYVAVLIARLVALYSFRAPAHPDAAHGVLGPVEPHAPSESATRHM